KPNLAFYDRKYRNVLKAIMKYAREKHPELLLILDAKRGDIFDTQEFYADADMANFAPDVMTINSYMGHKATLEPYYKKDDKICAFSLAATSNPDTEVQEMWTASGIKVYQAMALENRKAAPDRTGLVVGSTKTAAARNIRAAELEEGYKEGTEAWFLAPGFGKQGGDLSFVKFAGPKALYPISSGLVNPKYLDGTTPLEAVIKWKNAINDAGERFEMRSISERLVSDLNDNGLIWTAESADETTWRVLKSGIMSPIFFEMQKFQAYPDMMKSCVYLLQKKLWQAGLIWKEEIDKKTVVKYAFDFVAGVPEGGTVLGGNLAYGLNMPCVTIRKETKDHGQGGDYVALWKDGGGSWRPGKRALLVEDVATSGGSVLEKVRKMRADGLEVEDAIVIVDREQGAKANLAAEGVKLHSMFTALEAVEKLPEENNMRRVILNYMAKSIIK
ncbi:MAG: orotidine 5'-phosphate decarboxylase, partial [Rickettsiales bacterium]|nr:orotidine 5'-phosphate decarboxylase [Rickettsiales bacterium]